MRASGTGETSLERLAAHHSRDAKRYHIGPIVRYAVRRAGHAPVRGTGRLLNLSDSGWLFRSASKLAASDSILAALDWPVMTADGEAQFLVLTGTVVQVKGLAAAISITCNDVLRADEVDSCLELFSGCLNPAAPEPQTLAIPSIWIDKDDDPSNERRPATSAMFIPHGWPI